MQHSEGVCGYWLTNMPVANKLSRCFECGRVNTDFHELFSDQIEA